MARIYGLPHDALDEALDRSSNPPRPRDAAGAGERVSGPTEPDLRHRLSRRTPPELMWCRDVLELVEDLERGLSEAARVLMPDGRMLIYTNFATELLEPGEAAMIHGPLGHAPENIDADAVEEAFRRAGLAVERKDVVGTDWREHEEERARGRRGICSG